MRNPQGKSNSAIIEEVYRTTNISRGEIRWWFNRIVAAIATRLKRGEEVHIRSLGTLYVHKRRGRVVTWTRHPQFGTRTSAQRDGLCVRFRSSPTFNRKLK